MLDILENELSVSRNGYSFNFNHWRPTGVDHLADHVLRRLCRGISFENGPEASCGRPLWNPFWTIFGRSRCVPQNVTLHVTQAKSDQDVVSPTKTCGIDPKDLWRSTSSGPQVQLGFFPSVRPAGRTHISKFYSYGQPSVAIKNLQKRCDLI